jgi:hypothetical protein
VPHTPACGKRFAGSQRMAFGKQAPLQPGRTEACACPGFFHYRIGVIRMSDQQIEYGWLADFYNSSHFGWIEEDSGRRTFVHRDALLDGVLPIGTPLRFSIQSHLDEKTGRVLTRACRRRASRLPTRFGDPRQESASSPRWPQELARAPHTGHCSLGQPTTCRPPRMHRQALHHMARGRSVSPPCLTLVFRLLMPPPRPS